MRLKNKSIVLLMKIALCCFLVLNISMASFAMESPQEGLIKIIVGGDVDKQSLKRVFQELTAMPGAKYEFVEQLVDETLLNIIPDAYTFILYIIDYSNFKKFPKSLDKVVPTLCEAKRRFPKSSFPLNILLTKVNPSQNGFAHAEIMNYFIDKEVRLYLNNTFAVPIEFGNEKEISKDDLAELQMLKNNMFIWSK